MRRRDAFRPDSSTRAPNGNPSLKLENPDSCGPFTKQAVNEFVAPPGVYSIGGEIKTSGSDRTEKAGRRNREWIYSRPARQNR